MDRLAPAFGRYALNGVVRSKLVAVKLTFVTSGVAAFLDLPGGPTDRGSLRVAPGQHALQLPAAF